MRKATLLFNLLAFILGLINAIQEVNKPLMLFTTLGVLTAIIALLKEKE